MLSALEGLLSQYPATISTIAAGSTLAAVIVALYLAGRQSRPRLRVYADLNCYISSVAQTDSPVINLNDAPRVISVTVNNIGPVPVSISYWSSFHWRVLGAKEAVLQNPSEPDFRSRPIELEPGKSASVVLSFDLPANTAMMERLASSSWLGRWALRFPSLIVTTEVGDRFRAEMGKSLRALCRGQLPQEDG